MLGIDRFDIPNEQGSSHGFTRLIRLAYFEHPDYVPLLRHAYDRWHALARDSGQPIISITGGVYIGARAGDLVDGSLRASDRHSLDHELLDRGQLERRFPQFRMTDEQVALFDPQAGFLRPELAISTWVAQAMRDGAEIHGREQVLDWRSSGSRVTVTTSRGQYEAESLVLCAGAWTAPLLKDWKLPLKVTRQVTGFVQPLRNAAQFSAGRLPVWAVEHGGGLYYGAPVVPERPGLKVALHRPASATDPDNVDRSMSASDEAEIRWVIPRHLPDADGPLIGFRVCLYTNTPDGHFLVDRHPQFGNVVCASPCSGHGFKFAPVIGEVLADLATDGSTRHPIGFLAASRFAG